MKYTEYLNIPKYVQGRGVLQEIKRIVYPLGSKYLFLLGCRPIESDVRAAVEKSFRLPMTDTVTAPEPDRFFIEAEAQAYDAENKEVSYACLDVEGWQVSPTNIEKLWAEVERYAPDVIVAIGGGKTLDISRCVREKCGCGLVLVPTACATNAPGTNLSVIYKDDGSEILEMRCMAKMHDALLIDPELIIRAPARSLAAGIGDCMATYYEATVSARANGSIDTASRVQWSVLRETADVLYRCGYKGYCASKAGHITGDYEFCLEQIAIGSGIPGSAVGAISVAHIVDEILDGFAPARKMLHGERVGYGVLPLMVYAGTSLEKIYRYVDFAVSIHIPVTLEQIGLCGISDEELLKNCVRAASGSMAQFAETAFSPEALLGYIRTADQIVSEYLSISGPQRSQIL